MLKVEDGAIVESEQPALLALNETLRDAYIMDCERGLARWNKVIREAGVDFELRLPHRGFHRAIGEFRGTQVTPAGEIIAPDQWQKRQVQWLPTQADREFVASLMKPETRPGKFAGWIAPPIRGINLQPIEFEYVVLPHN